MYSIPLYSIFVAGKHNGTKIIHIIEKNNDVMVEVCKDKSAEYRTLTIWRRGEHSKINNAFRELVKYCEKTAGNYSKTKLKLGEIINA